MPIMLAQAQQQGGAAPMPANVTWAFVVGGTVVAIVMFGLGGLWIYSGVSVMKYRRRTLAIVALAAGMVTFFTCYCFPTSLVMGIYGLIFLLNEPVARAFQMGSQGKSVQEIQQHFAAMP